jgi:hypothetical protein
VEGWLAARRARIRGRIDTLTDDAVTTQPRWLTDSIGPRPVTAAAEDAYLQVVRAAAAHRDRYTITGSSAVGPEPPHEGPQLRAWRAATNRIEDYRDNARTADQPAQTAAGQSLREQVAARAEEARQETAARRARAERDLAAQRAQQRRAQEPRAGRGGGPRR